MFLAENETQQKVFNDYVQYFQEKDRVSFYQLIIMKIGMVYLKNGLMFVVPPSQASKRYFSDDQGATQHPSYLLGVFVDQEAAQQQAAKFPGGIPR